MKLKTYQAWTMSEALAFVKKDLGADAVILHTRTFERGGFFGFGRKAVVEITAARAADMPKGEQARGEGEKADTATSERRGASRGFKSATLAAPGSLVATTSNASNGSAAAGASLAARAAKHEVVQFSAAARAYGAASEIGKVGSAGLTRSDAANAGGASGASVSPLLNTGLHTGMNTGMNPGVNTGMPLDMDAEREKTRRLAQAMAIQLEKQTSERANAARNERATGAAARATGAAARATGAAARASESASKPASAFGTPSSARIASPEIGVVTTEPVGPAQRFVLVPEVRTIGANSGGAGATVARLQTIAVPAPQIASASPVLASPVSTSPVSTSPVSASASATATRVDVVKAASHAAPSSVSRTADAAEPAPATERRELDTISAFVGRFLRDGSGEPLGTAVETKPHASTTVTQSTQFTRLPQTARPATLEAAYAQLIEQEVARELADRILTKVECELADAIDAGATPSASAVREAIEREIAALLPADSEDGFRFESAMTAAQTRAHSRGGESSARRIAFVGPTGVGKTTTLAKIAAQLSLKRGLKVGIVAADTYRIAAVDQLRTYAEILGIAVEVASSPTDAARACERLGDVDVILIDTAGRSQNDRMKLSELRAFLAAAEPDETHLVLSATAGARTLAREAESFGALGIDRLVLTKLDEAASFGTLISLVERLGTRVSFLTHGQEVPEHIETARGRRLASLVMGSEVR